MKVSNEAKIGILVAAVVVLLAVLTFKAGDFKFSKEGYIVKVHFQNIDGISTNAPVMFNGLEVGSVKDINIIEKEGDTFLELDVFLEQNATLRQGTKAYVKNLGFLGEKYVGLTAGDAGADPLEPGAIIIGQEPADLDRLMQDGQEIAAKLKSIVTNVDERLEINKKNIDDILANLNDSVNNIVSISDRLDERLAANEGKIDSILTNLDSSTRNLDQFTYDLKLNPWKLLYRDKERREANVKEMLEEQEE